jgi:hypothetical protein
MRLPPTQSGYLAATAEQKAEAERRQPFRLELLRSARFAVRHLSGVAEIQNLKIRGLKIMSRRCICR